MVGVMGLVTPIWYVGCFAVVEWVEKVIFSEKALGNQFFSPRDVLSYIVLAE